MKIQTQLIGCLATLLTVIASCGKNGSVNNYIIPPSPPDSLRAREFIFDSLTWKTDFCGIGFNDFYLSTAGLINHSGWPMEVSIRIDTSSGWINVPHWHNPYCWNNHDPSPMPANNGYVYDDNYYQGLYIFSFINQSNSAYVSIRVKFF